jgi:hypothetical protein
MSAAIATRHASTSPSLRMGPVLQARDFAATDQRRGVTRTLAPGRPAAAASAGAGRRPASCTVTWA